jgi:signal transduction histidine kinase
VGADGHGGDELARLSDAFDRMAAQVQRLVESQRQLLRDISHELRSPLARLQVALGLARQRDAGGAQRELDRIEREAQALDDMIGELLTLVRLDAAAVVPERTEVDLTRLVADVVDDAAFQARAHGKALVLDAGPSVHVRGQPGLLRRAVDNVIRNAVHYTAPGTRVEVVLAVRTPQEVTVSVADRGPGVPAEMLDRIFEPFVRVDGVRAHERGVGLGLAITARAVALHGGRVRARNRDDGGLVVELTLPTEIKVPERTEPEARGDRG